jgi:fused signal recognition particle receptor
VSWFKFGFGKKKKDSAEEAELKGSEAQEAAKDEALAAPEEPSAPAPERVSEEAAEGDHPSTDDADATHGASLEDSDGAAEREGAETVEPEAGPDPAAAATDPPAPEERKGFFARLASGLKKSSSRFSDSVSAVFTKRKLDDDALEELEDLLIAADLGAVTAAKVTARLAKDKFDKDVSPEEIKQALADVVAETLQPYEAPLDMSGPSPQVVLFVGVNGSGKTTTLGKIAVKMTREGGDVITAAGDTFRAAAVEQLEVWSKRAGATFLSRPIGSDAAGLAYDAYDQARREAADAVLIDTAGRLQNKAELMDELRKIVRVLKKQDESAPHHVVLVLDGTVGSNAISQAEAFMEAANVTGVIMTKLDGTAKGGALVQVA